MILSNVEILDALKTGSIKIFPLVNDSDPQNPPFNTTAIDLRLDAKIAVPAIPSIAIDLRKGGVSDVLTRNCEKVTISQRQPFALEPNKFILSQTVECVEFPINQKNLTYAARVEGRSSFARCGLLVHFTAPTIHANFEGNITLEIINLAPWSINLYPEMYICQLIIEEVKGAPIVTENQFKGQQSPMGNV